MPFFFFFFLISAFFLKKRNNVLLDLAFLFFIICLIFCISERETNVVSISLWNTGVAPPSEVCSNYHNNLFKGSKFNDFIKMM